MSVEPSYMSEPKVVSFLKLQGEHDLGAEKRPGAPGITGFDFQRLFATSASRADPPMAQTPPTPPLPGLEIGFLLGQRKVKNEKNEKNLDPTHPAPNCTDDAFEASKGHLPPARINAAYAALLEAVREQNDFKVQEVLQLVGSKVLERKDGDGNTVLHLAAKISASETSTSILSYLQHCRADLEARNVLGETPLILAVREALDGKEPAKPGEPDPGWLGAVSCLLEGRADPNGADELNEETPLMEAACYGSCEMCQLLLDFQADVLMKTASGGTAMDFASSEGHDPLVKLLRRELTTREAREAREASASQGTSSGNFQGGQAPFATAIGFNTWSGGLAERWSQPPQAPTPDDAREEKRKESSSQSNDSYDFKPGLLFGSQASSFNVHSHFMADGGYRSHKESHFPFAERSGRQQKAHKAANQDQHFQTLGLSPQACAEEIRAAYRKLARQYHPDKNQGSKEAAEKFRQVRRAYEQLSTSF